MGCKVKVNRRGYLAFRLYWNRTESWEGTGLKDTPENRKIAEGRAVLITREIKNGTFDYLKRFPKGNKTHLFRSKAESEAESKTIGDYFDEWIKTKRPPVVRKSLERDYRQCFRRYILPQLGEVRLKDVTTRLLESFRRYLLERALSLKTVRNIIDGPFRAMMRDARIIDKLITEDPFIGLQWPAMAREKPDPFSEAERDKILNYFRQKVRFEDYVFLYTLFWTGMRPSEATALRWGDVDLNAGRAEITKSRHLGAENAPKTRASRRTISLLPTVVELLRTMKPLILTESDYVFRDERGRHLMQRNGAGDAGIGHCGGVESERGNFTVRATPTSLLL